MSKFGIEPMTPRMREASDRLYERCMEISNELAPLIDEACGGDQRKLWTVIGSAHWELAFVALAMMHPKEDEFVQAMKSQPVSESDLRAKHREIHDQYTEECGAVYDIHLFS